MPISVYIRDLITSGKIGTVQRTFADLSVAGSFEDTSRMVNPDLAGGSLLDLGIYSLTWVFQTLYTVQKNPQTPSVVSSLRKEKRGCDELTTMVVTFPRENAGDAHGIATTGLVVASDPSKKNEVGPSIRIQGTQGEIQVVPPAFNPPKSRLMLNDGTVEEKDWTHPGPGKGSGFYNGFGQHRHSEGQGMGMFWEADECAYALRDGRKEGQYESLAESLVIMEVMDEVRRQGGFKLPEKVESTEYPLELSVKSS